MKPVDIVMSAFVIIPLITLCIAAVGAVGLEICEDPLPYLLILGYITAAVVIAFICSTFGLTPWR